MNITSNFLVPSVLVLVCAGIVAASMAGRALPLIATPRAALLALLVIGMAACMGGIGQVGASGRWASPLAIIGSLLGAAILVVIAAVFFGWKLPLIHTVIRSDSQAVLAVGLLMAVKYLIGTAGYFFRWL